MTVNAIVSPKEQLAIRIVCKEYYDILPPASGQLLALDDDMCKQPAVLAAAALLHSRVGAIKGILNIITAGAWTSLSDKYGRKALILNTLLTLIASLMLSWFMASERNPFGSRVLYLDAVMVGLTSGNIMLNPAAMAYVADCTSVATRSISIGYGITSFALGSTIGPYLGGYLAKRIGAVSLIKVGILVYFAIVAYVQLLPESLREGSKKSPAPLTTEEVSDDPSVLKMDKSFASRLVHRLKSAFKTVVGPLKIFVPGQVPVSDNVPSKYTLILFLLAGEMSLLASIGNAVNFYAFTNLVFGWGEFEDGIFLSFTGAFSFITFFWCFPRLQSLYRRRCGSFLSSSPSTDPSIEDAPTQERSISDQGKVESLRMDIAFFNIGTILEILGPLVVVAFLSPTSMFIGAGIATLGSFSGPSQVSVLTTLVPADRVGGTLGAMCVADAITIAFANLLFGVVFAHTSATKPWMYLYVSASLSLLAVCAGLSLQALYRRRRIAL
ncbi:hypothetical protein BGZ52_002848 [Haplosporangium bisporale]|nr:hypothetical protein BGZ52_002848 [Haplosporangium bisporale]